MGKEWDRLGASVEATAKSAGGFGKDSQANENAYAAARVRFGATAKQMQEWHQAWATEALRVLKPGGHLLAFGGTRTYHRLACAVEDAGFEIRDSVIWLYGSGFPKSLDVSKAIDRAAGAEREVLGTRRAGIHRAGRTDEEGGIMLGGPPEELKQAPITAPATPEAQRWQGWGTALKPSHEPVVCAQKPLGLADWLATIGSHLDRLEAEWQAQEVDPTTPTGEGGDSSGQTATSPSESETTTSWSIVTSWRRSLVELSQAASTFTTETATALTTVLKTLSSCLGTITGENTPDNPSPTSGSLFPVEAADNLFAAAVLSLRGTLALSAGESATESTAQPSPDADAALPSPAHEPIVVARKPLIGTVAQTVSEWGTGALNIDGCRIGTEEIAAHGGGVNHDGRKYGGGSGIPAIEAGANPHTGRWPANVALSHLSSRCCLGCDGTGVDGDGESQIECPECGGSGELGGCERVGERRVKTNVATKGHVGTTDSSSLYGFGGGDETPRGYADPDGLETVPAWACVEGCPVAELDRQSGERPGSHAQVNHSEGFGGASPLEFASRQNKELGYGDTGGASRFFYCAKSSRAERTVGVGANAHPT
jgi:hypothetical protein